MEGPLLLSCANADSALKVSSVRGGEVRHRLFPGQTLAQCDVDWQNSVIAVCMSSTIALVDPQTLDVRHTLEFNAWNVLFLSQSPLLLCGGNRGEMLLFNTDTMTDVSRKKYHSDTIRGFAQSPNNALIASSSDDRTIFVMHTETLEVVAHLRGHEKFVMSMLFKPDNNTLISCSMDHSINVWDVAASSVVKRLNLHSDHVWMLSFTRDGTRFLSASSDHRLAVWDAVTYENLSVVMFDANVYSVVCSPVSEAVFVGVQNTGVFELDLATQERYSHAGEIWGLSCTRVPIESSKVVGVQFVDVDLETV
eukprot:m.431617 g.431617  ORF g.431617 m.431617 type:complete len:308 (-) comp56739_c2_seq1:199-1122(-)